MSNTATLIMEVRSDGYIQARERLRALAAEGAKAELASKRLASSVDSDAEKQWQSYQKLEAKRDAQRKREAQMAARAAERESETIRKSLRSQDEIQREYYNKRKAWIDANIKDELRRSELLDRLSKRTASVGYDGVLPIRPSLQRIEARLGEDRGTSFGGLAAAVGFGGLAGAAAGLVGMQGAKKVVEEAAAYEALIQRLRGVTDSAEEARQTFDALEKTSDSMMESENELVDAFLKLANEGIKPTMDDMTAFANVAAASGGKVSGVVEAIAAAEMGTYKGLKQFGVLAKDEGDNISVTFRGTTTTIEKSKDAILGYMASLGKVEFAGAAERQLHTMGGSVKTLKDAWGDLYREIGLSPIGDAIKSGIGFAAQVVGDVTTAVHALVAEVEREPDVKISKGLKKLIDDAKKIEEVRKSIASGEALPDPEEQAAEQEAEARKERVQQILDKLEQGDEAGRRLREYMEGRQDLLKLAATPGYSFDVRSALAELDRQYAASAGGGAKAAKPDDTRAKAIAELDAIFANIDTQNQRAKNQQIEAMVSAYQREYEAMASGLAREEDAELASYEKRKQFFQTYAGEDAAEKLAANEVAWQKVQEQRARHAAQEESERQRKRDSLLNAPAEDDEIAQIQYRAGQKIEALRVALEEEKDLNGEALITQEEFEQAKTAIVAKAAAERRNFEYQQAQLSLAAVSNTFGSLAEVSKKHAGEQSALYKVMFATSRAFAIAEATVQMGAAAAKAANTPWPANVAAYLQVVAMGAGIVAQIANASYSGAYDSGGYIPAGGVGLVGERGPELVRGPAMVTGRRETARMFAENASSGTSNPVNVNVLVDSRDIARSFRGLPEFHDAVRAVIQSERNTIRAMARS